MARGRRYALAGWVLVGCSAGFSANHVRTISTETSPRATSANVGWSQRRQSRSYSSAVVGERGLPSRPTPSASHRAA